MSASSATGSSVGPLGGFPSLTHFSLSFWWMIFEAIHEFLGGRHVITVVAVLYITDITTIENRSAGLVIMYQS